MVERSLPGRRRVLEWQLHVAHLVGFDDQSDAVWIITHRKWLSDVFVGNGIHDLKLRVGAMLDHTSTNLRFHVRISKVDKRNCHSRVTASVARLQRLPARAYDEPISLATYPDRRAMRCSVFH